MLPVKLAFTFKWCRSWIIGTTSIEFELARMSHPTKSILHIMGIRPASHAGERERETVPAFVTFLDSPPTLSLSLSLVLKLMLALSLSLHMRGVMNWSSSNHQFQWGEGGLGLRGMSLRAVSGARAVGLSAHHTRLFSTHPPSITYPPKFLQTHYFSGLCGQTMHLLLPWTLAYMQTTPN